MSMAEHMCQTTLMQCFDLPPVATALAPPPSATAFGYRCIDIDGHQYLLNDTTNHLLVVPPAAKKMLCLRKPEA
jgi:hypothetical protein